MENYISIQEAVSRYCKSLSTIKKVVKGAKGNDRKQGEKLNTGLHKVLISVSFLDRHFKTIDKQTESIEDSRYTNSLNDRIKDQQKTIDKLLQNQEAFLERQHEQNILLERATQRAALLEKHFDRNRRIDTTDKTEEVIQEEEAIEEIIADKEPIVNDSDFINANDEESFSNWLKSMQNN